MKIPISIWGVGLVNAGVYVVFRKLGNIVIVLHAGLCNKQVHFDLFF